MSVAGNILRTAHETGAINSRLPEHWQTIRDTANPLAPQVDALDRLRQGFFGVMLFSAVLYTTMVALASFGMMPFGEVIIEPYLALVAWVERLVAWIRG